MPSAVFPLNVAHSSHLPSAMTETSLAAPQGLLASITAEEVAIKDLGRCLLPSPVAGHLGDHALHFVGKADKVLVHDTVRQLEARAESLSDLPAFELAGPRNKIFFDPRQVRCGIVTCGGLCPGLNNVVRGLVLELFRAYGVKRVLGFRYGYEGIVSRFGHLPIALTPDLVANVHHGGGTLLGSSRGAQDPVEVVDNLEALGIDVLFVVGGDGTIRGTKVVMEVRAREVPFMIYDGQTSFKVLFERLRSRPDRVYGAGLGSSYQRQTLTLSKHFRRL